MRNRSMALVVRDGKILMIKTLHFNRWELPGGGIEKDETPEETAIRELKEECGLDGVINRPLNILHCKDGSVEYVDITNDMYVTDGGYSIPDFSTIFLSLIRISYSLSSKSYLPNLYTVPLITVLPYSFQPKEIDCSSQLKMLKYSSSPFS